MSGSAVGEVDALAERMGKKMRRWSAETLEQEAMFAALSDDGSDECEAWQRAIEREKARRIAGDQA